MFRLLLKDLCTKSILDVIKSENKQIWLNFGLFLEKTHYPSVNFPFHVETHNIYVCIKKANRRIRENEFRKNDFLLFCPTK
jgi:hypothetical protein